MSRATPDLTYEHLRKILIQARNAAGLTQVKLAERLRRPQSFVSKYERGERRLDIGEFIEVAGALGIDPVSVVAHLVAPPPKTRLTSRR